MSIVHFDHYRVSEDNPNGLKRSYPDYTEWPEGAYCPLNSSYNTKDEIERVGALVLWETHRGLCLSEREANFYDDSDFYMRVWNPEKKCVHEIMFATTRGWSYPSLASCVDATKEVIEAAEQWMAEQKAIRIAIERKAKAKKLFELRVQERELAQKHGFSRALLRKWKKTEHPEKVERAMKLLTTDLRSSFRIDLRRQLVEFLQQTEPKYKSPFSRKQWDYV